MYDIITVENIYSRNFNNVRKYRNFMSLMDVYYFEYGMNDNYFKIFTYINERAKLIISDNLDAWYENNALHCVDTDKDRFALDKLIHSLKNGLPDFTVHITGTFFTKDASKDDITFTGRTIAADDGNYVYGIIRNSTIRNEGNTAYYLTESAKDSATGLLNKRAVTEFSKDIIDEHLNNIRYMIIIDIDDFKNVNDTYGHMFGDNVILTVARLLANIVNVQGIVGRIGGDEFYILTENINSEQELRTLIKVIYKNLMFAYEDKKIGFNISLSCGISCYPKDGTDYNTLFKKADKALYIAKEKGKARYIIYDEKKHGAVAVDDNNNITTSYNPALKSEAIASTVSDLIINLKSQGTDGIDTVLSAIRGFFDIDGIRIYKISSISPYQYTLIYTSGSYKQADIHFDTLGTEQFIKSFNSFSMYAENNVKNILKYSNELYELLAADEIASFLQVAFPDIKSPKFIITFDTFNRRRKWSDEDKNFLLILSKLILNML